MNQERKPQDPKTDLSKVSINELIKRGWPDQTNGESDREKTGVVFIIVVACVGLAAYAFAFLDAMRNPWTLWHTEWREGSNHWEVKRVKRFDAEINCVGGQWKMLDEELKRQHDVNKLLVDRKLDLTKYVYVREGRTIFEFGQSIYETDPQLRERLFNTIEKNNDLTPYQKDATKRDALLPKITATWTYFCTETASPAYWPFYTPNTDPAKSDLERLNAGTLTDVTAKLRSKPEQSISEK